MSRYIHNLLNFIKTLFHLRTQDKLNVIEISPTPTSASNLKEINLNHLPSQNLFYNDDFKIYIKKADIDDIKFYNENYIDGDYIKIFNNIKYIVINNVFLDNGYDYNNILAIDILYLFFEISRLTTNHDIIIKNDFNEVIFNSDNFNYFNLKERSIKIKDGYYIQDGFKYSPPTIGAETAISEYVFEKSNTEGVEKYTELSYDFIYFLGYKTEFSNTEIDNLIYIFNYDLSVDDKIIISKIISKFKDMSKYSLKIGDTSVTLEGVDLKNILN